MKAHKRVKAKWVADKTDLPVPIGLAGMSMWRVNVAVTTTEGEWESVESHELYVVAGVEKDALSRVGRLILRLKDGVRS